MSLARSFKAGKTKLKEYTVASATTEPITQSSLRDEVFGGHCNPALKDRAKLSGRYATRTAVIQLEASLH